MDTTNEPVAWLLQTETAHQFTFKEPTIVPQNVFPIPLYTHPNEADLGVAEAIGFEKGYNTNKLDDLTKEDILCLWDWWSGEILATDILDFADTYKRVCLGKKGYLNGIRNTLRG